VSLDAELLVELGSVLVIAFGEHGHDVAQCLNEGSDLRLRELAAGHDASELGLERLAFTLDLGDPLRDRGEGRVETRTQQLADTQAALLQAQKLESIGQLAAGVAHEINTPIQFIGDNLRFLESGFGELIQLAQRTPQSVQPTAAPDDDIEYIVAVGVAAAQSA
jgi:signal transduction histidine kinase